MLRAAPAYLLQVGSDASIGHGAVCHGCTIEDGVLIGMGAVVMNGAIFDSRSTVATDAVVPSGMQVPPGNLVAGVPAKVLRKLTSDAVIANRENALIYIVLAAEHRAGRIPRADVGLGIDAAHRTSPHRAARQRKGMLMSGTDLTMTTSDGVRAVYDDEGEGRAFLQVRAYDGLRAHWDF
ncbi:hypothetical protein E1202_17250 [Saccharopolyspora karakumensis]|uniref:Carbonic anhydrase or acetyltransferase, isoleucine patch superfamily n=1 Tax=Saccharopolyspora karakumensis TaxID=2530386 RepID=A0A4R5BK76_9PSEU|nr:hypothetical protein [Saccharopolyspora karakumensis]TDD87061.1 hypothetical protein E1202_17250 [Saccharopolyspora karakumensis]